MYKIENLEEKVKQNPLHSLHTHTIKEIFKMFV